MDILLKLFTVYVYMQSVFCGCGAEQRQHNSEKANNKFKVSRIGRLDSRILESSGLAHADSNTFWTHPDAGNAANLFRVNLDGDLLETLPLPLKNIDWEDLAKDDKGYLYIGDFGNNLNNRQDLRIYKISSQTYTLVGTIDFTFEDQVYFPPDKSNLTFDLEAFFYYNDSLYLFTKSRSKPLSTKLYRLAATPGKYKATLLKQFPLKAMVTAADISPTEKEFALLGYGKLYLFEFANGQVNLQGKKRCVTIGKTGQAEGILYLDKDHLLITNEKGKLYMVGPK